MTDQNDDYDDDNTDTDEAPRERNWRRKLEDDAKAGREAQSALAEAQAQAAAAQRELVMRRAGVDIDSPLGAMFSKAYDGAPEADSVVAAWSAITGQAPPDTSGIPADQQAAMARISGSMNGGVPAGGQAPDFERELDSVPILVDGRWNPNYVNEVLAKTAEQATREGREFNAVGAGAKWAKGGTNVPSTTPLR